MIDKKFTIIVVGSLLYSLVVMIALNWEEGGNSIDWDNSPKQSEIERISQEMERQKTFQNADRIISNLEKRVEDDKQYEIELKVPDEFYLSDQVSELRSLRGEGIEKMLKLYLETDSGIKYLQTVRSQIDKKYYDGRPVFSTNPVDLKIDDCYRSSVSCFCTIKLKR